MKVQTLASGSSGNCTFIDTGRSKILVDAGIAARKLSAALGDIGVRMEQIDAVVITHEHGDHTRAITSMPVPVYVSSATSQLWRAEVPLLCEFQTGEAFEVGDARITPFPVLHDALDPVGFTVENGAGKAGIVTDIGSQTEVVSNNLQGCDILIVEANHDESRLISGRYPWDLKMRVGGRLGHLSNRQCSKLLKTVAHDGLRFVVLAHLSEANNMPELALEAAREGIGGCGASVHVAPRKSSGEEFAI